MVTTSHDSASAESLDASRHALIRQLHDHPDDVAATVELQAVKAASARLATTVDTSESDSLRRAGLSFFDRLFHRGSREGP
jgi:hypothetical protein